MHKHKALHVSEGKSRDIEICECGATRIVSLHPRIYQEWHTCKLCTHPWGLGVNNGKR
jgi:hypothetical protein